MALPPLVIDVETVGVDWESLPPDIQQYLLDRVRTEEERRNVPGQLALHPATGRVIAIGMWRPDEDRGGVLIEGEGCKWTNFEGGAKVFRGSEENLLREFWRYISERAGTIITFNGRRFDGPFLMLRSAFLSVEPTRNLVPYRFSFREHCDLAEVVTFFGARPLESLHFWCRQFGIKSPKNEMNGSRVGEVYRQGDLDRIARYCLGDAKSTAELYKRLKPLITLMEKTAPGYGTLL